MSLLWVGMLDPRVTLISDYSLDGDLENAARLAEEVPSNDPEFSLKRYAKSQAYKGPAALEETLSSLQQAGLPD